MELELQAEVDKFVCCALLLGGASRGRHQMAGLRRRLYHDVEFAGDLDADEHDRYRAANSAAGRYASTLDARYVAPDRMPAMLEELRWFYRQGLDGKLGHISRVTT